MEGVEAMLLRSRRLIMMELDFTSFSIVGLIM